MAETKEKTEKLIAILSPIKQGTPGKESLYLLIPKETRDTHGYTENTSFALYESETGDLLYKKNAT